MYRQTRCVKTGNEPHNQVVYTCAACYPSVAALNCSANLRDFLKTSHNPTVTSQSNLALAPTQTQLDYSTGWQANTGGATIIPNKEWVQVCNKLRFILKLFGLRIATAVLLI